MSRTWRSEIRVRTRFLSVSQERQRASEPATAACCCGVGKGNIRAGGEADAAPVPPPDGYGPEHSPQAPLRRLVPGAICNATLCLLRLAEADLEDGLSWSAMGPKREELNVSKSRPLYLAQQTSTKRAATSPMGCIRSRA